MAPVDQVVLMNKLCRAGFEIPRLMSRGRSCTGELH